MKADERNQQNQPKFSHSYGEDSFDQLEPLATSVKPERTPHETSLIFFGSGPVAATSLASLVDSFEIECVITKQAPSHHRGSVPVVELAQKLQLPIEFANSRQELDNLVSRLKFKSRLGVIVDYGVIVSQLVIDALPLGIVNSHFSLLPEWRGADPITFTVLSGQAETGVSLMLIVEQLDEGQLIAQEKMPLSGNITTPDLTNRLVEKSNQMLKQYLPLYLSGDVQPYNQPDLHVTYSRKLTKADGTIDWTKPAEQVEREVRAFIEWPKSSTRLGGKDIIITQARVVDSQGKPGAVLEKKARLVIGTGKDALEILKLKPAGKQEMPAEAFLAGYGQLL